MKYWTELTELETQIIRLESLTSLLRVVAIGSEQANDEDVRNAIWYIEGSIEDIHATMRSEFDNLWDMIRDEPEPEKHKGGMKKKKMMTDRELP